MPKHGLWADDPFARYGEGTQIIRPESWQSLASVLLHEDVSEWAFRGQRNASWVLSTRLERVRQVRKAGVSQKRTLEVEAIRHFVLMAQQRGITTPSDYLSLIALMQHYGAPTRLLDWSLSPFVALYFAFENTSPIADEEDEAALMVFHHVGSSYVYNLPSHKSAFNIKYRQDDQMIWPEGAEYLKIEPMSGEQNRAVQEAIKSKSSFPMPVVPTLLDDRLAAQQSIFTLSPNLDRGENGMLGAEEWDRAPGEYGHSPEEPSFLDHIAGDKSMLLKKVIMPKKWRQDALDSLNVMNINASTLFPGLDGIGRATAQNLEIDFMMTVESKLAEMIDDFRRGKANEE